MNQERRKQAAQQAREEIRKAIEEQERGNGEKAEEHLKNALDTLKQDRQNDQGDQGDQEQNEQDRQGEQEGEQEQQGEQDDDGQQAEQPRQAEAQEAPKDQGEMDKQQAEAILNMMLKDELDSKDVNQARPSIRPVEKDW